MTATTADLSFKFHFVTNGRAQGFAKKGSANNDSIILGKDVLKYDDIIDTTTRDQRIVLVLASTVNLAPNLSKSLAGGSSLVLEVNGSKARELERQIDRITSQKAIANRKHNLLQLGQGDLLRAVSCPECEAAVDLTDFERTSHIYCRFCESIFKENQPTLTKGDTYRICDECGMFDRVKGYTEFYFYFLIFIYGFSYKRRYMCDHCAHNLFVKMFWINLIFLLGIPFALYVKFKSMTGRSPELQQLSRANALAKKGQYQKAESIYQQLYQHHLEHPGLLLNEGIAHLNGKDGEGALHCWRRSLQSCANYHPTLRLLYSLQKSGQ
ncbi:tetratricopeptide repeat protein [Oscillatoria sp. FACHB-1407]|uniref:tetratricopeptide repeat protein n=1 Tax=Oscillatoria sp. FACHB-1407 TaxID=2692847 RepID=UPI001688C3EA|nr:tetratricopeptide repeat protein [Oscillatoria sp. FACHB-1407]MBD2463784.1 tetratricopeptide repeat protein [Oscillatoria sp. FACHB-1407]